MSSIEARKSAKLEGSLVDKDVFISIFNSGRPSVYYRGASLAADIELDKTDTYRQFQKWIWRYVIDEGRGTFARNALGLIFMNTWPSRENFRDIFSSRNTSA